MATTPTVSNHPRARVVFPFRCLSMATIVMLQTTAGLHFLIISPPAIIIQGLDKIDNSMHGQSTVQLRCGGSHRVHL